MSPEITLAGRIRAIVNPDGGLLLDTRTGLLFSMNRTGAIIWGELERGQEINDIAETLVNTLPIEQEVALRDVTDFITILRGTANHIKLKLLVCVSDLAMYYTPVVRVLNLYPTPAAQERFVDWRIERLEKALTGTLSCPTLRTLSVTVGLSAGHLGRRFRRTTGVGFRNYASQLKLQRALNLLRSSDLSVKEISNLLGYRHTSDFCHHFKQASNLTPSQFRQCVKTLDVG